MYFKGNKTKLFVLKKMLRCVHYLKSSNYLKWGPDYKFRGLGWMKIQIKLTVFVVLTFSQLNLLKALASWEHLGPNIIVVSLNQELKKASWMRFLFPVVSKLLSNLFVHDNELWTEIRDWECVISLRNAKENEGKCPYKLIFLSLKSP